nr:MAG TPA: hypothetical protein [Caudoviricetes sp.]
MGCYYYICTQGFLRTSELRRSIAVPRFVFWISVNNYH